MSRTVAALLALVLVLVAPVPAFATAGDEWRFRVLLDDREIGSHRFTVTERNGERVVESDASFAVKFLFVDAYRYVHSARERWRGDCLESIEARTDDNGRELRVRGVREGERLDLATPDGRASLPGCVMSFAYWNPAMLEQPRLLNAQTGEHAEVRVEPLGNEPLVVRDRQVLAQRYAVHADGFRVDLWYAPGNRWVQLESRTANGQRLRYLIQ
jgi:hypothetical protein